MPTTGAFDNPRTGPFPGSERCLVLAAISPPPLHRIPSADLHPPADSTTTTATNRRP